MYVTSDKQILCTVCTRLVYTLVFIGFARAFFACCHSACRPVFFLPTAICLSSPYFSSSLLPRDSDLGSPSGHFSPPTTVRAFVFIARRVQHFLRVESCVNTLLGAICFCYVVNKFRVRIHTFDLSSHEEKPQLVAHWGDPF